MRSKVKSRWTAATLAMVLLLSACGSQPTSADAAQSPPPLTVAPTVQASPPSLPYTREVLTVQGLDVEPGEAYYLPMGEGKYVPATDKTWQEYLDGQELSALESFSMPFVGVGQGETALVYVMENPYRATVRFSGAPELHITLAGEASSLAPSEENTVRTYTTQNNAAAVAQAYRDYLDETREVLTLADKEAKNPNIAKLYGAPHIYLWGDFLLAEEDVKWQALIKSAGSPVLAHISRLLADTEDGKAFGDMLKAIAGQAYVDRYQRSVLLRGLSTVLTQEDFFDRAVLTQSNSTIQKLLTKESSQRNPMELIELNKQALYENLPGVFEPVSGWYADASTDILDEMKAAGINTAWIGLNSWEQAFHTPALAKTAVDNGYLIGPYDSYHSIHEPGKEQWETAKFSDLTLYESATVTNEKGQKISGFQNVGRKLNPTLAMPSVKQRVQEILRTGVPLNSWFVDCDATGEVYDDYSPNHPTTKQQDVAARLERMDYIAEQHKMVVGSEGGNDFAANSIAFGHGIELQSFSWMDEDMKANKDSPYYLGRYYSARGGVPEKFAKPVPVKERYRTLFLDMSYQIPLYKLVYNDCVIPSYHWDWSTFKITGEVENRMLREVLYNVPPMYHLDRAEWDTYKDKITAHQAVWSPFSKKAITRKMTDFRQLTDDRLVQMTQYGENLQAVANFSGTEYTYEGTGIPPRSVLILDGSEKQIYTP